MDLLPAFQQAFEFRKQLFSRLGIRKNDAFRLDVNLDNQRSSYVKLRKETKCN